MSTQAVDVGWLQDRAPGRRCAFHRSSRRFEFNCAGRRIRERQYAFDAGPIVEDTEVGRYAESGNWEALVDGATKQGPWQIACAKG